jgi:hypothetical protein
MSAVKNRCENIGRKFFFSSLLCFVVEVEGHMAKRVALFVRKVNKTKERKAENNGGRRRKRDAIDETRLTVFDLEERGIGKTRRGWTDQNRIVDNPMHTQPCTFCHFLALSHPA